MTAVRLNDRINVVLLIIFMVVTPMIKPGVEVQVPEAEKNTRGTTRLWFSR